VAPPLVHDVLGAAGQPLDGAVRARMEPRFRHSFADVRVHADTRAGESARAVGAHAYAVGPHLVFGAGRYAPGSADGNRLIAHELAHVVQGRGAASVIQPKLEIGPADDPAEREADAAARAVMDGGPAGFLAPGGAALRRLPVGELEGPPGIIGYREAHEYSECLRIMGEENTAYCREEVLGIRPPAGPYRRDPLGDMSTFQSPGASGWWGARYGCYRNGCTRRHRGWDLHAPTGTPVLAAETGRVQHRDDPGGYGTYLMLASDSHEGLSFLYGHLSAREPAASYAAGAQIGVSGISGNASADRPHLHFEVHQSGTAVDPSGYFTEPSQVVDTAGTAVEAINKSLAAPCTPC
jgi:hypothetical protein